MSEINPDDYFHALKNENGIQVSPSRTPNGNTTGRVVGETPSTPVSASQANPPVEEDGFGFWDGLQLALDGIGLIPVVGEVADGANAVISLVRGNTAEAALSAAAMIPFAGWGATTGKVGYKLGKEATERAAKEAAQRKRQSGQPEKRQNGRPSKVTMCPRGKAIRRSSRARRRLMKNVAT